MLHYAKLDKYFEAEAAMTAIYIKNRLPSPTCQDQTPFEIVNAFRPSVKHMRVFGCRTFALTPKEKRSKWDPKAREGLLMGYEEVSKAYRVYDIEADQVVISRDATFDESTFGFSPTLPQEMVDDTALYIESMNISDEPHPMQFKQTGKRKIRSNSQEQVLQRTLPERRGTGLEESSAPDDFESHQAKRRSSARDNLDEERKGSDEDNEDATPQVFWRASANAVEGTDLSEPTTFGDAVVKSISQNCLYECRSSTCPDLPTHGGGTPIRALLYDLVLTLCTRRLGWLELFVTALGDVDLAERLG
uniref:Retroviral polymerase SH3-like domain-containing protein n=1 Tax=Peronospora matthiolae TaxID=2874970 RepID=A0AAV1VG57_9STRA